jgi:hypothetical protein
VYLHIVILKICLYIVRILAIIDLFLRNLRFYSIIVLPHYNLVRRLIDYFRVEPARSYAHYILELRIPHFEVNLVRIYIVQTVRLPVAVVLGEPPPDSRKVPHNGKL